ncbi:T9SS type A sorting domain-containing protein [Flavobacterium sp. LS1R47]|uniref:T9SS type A sorting domain-containing protein n=1 Tax=Flavobacterium frigoritolerans TaxID=2987686 RepID=A0A9X3C6B3_9FLAO|nr:T9SS type A sorting domain-containing protein [Flavobacterium frigoritolerans]MCV9931829.1 T9SS type A sorting domain-containing protein [Flavobacterium frigoritolerans]
MKKFYLLLFLLVSAFSFAQIDLTGDANYKLNIIGYQGRDGNGCGDIDGLKHIKATRRDGSTFFIFNGRKLFENVDYESIYTKNNPIVNLEFYKVVRWKNGFGNCDGGPNNNYDNVKITNTCFSSYQANAGSSLFRLTVTSKPSVVINESAKALYLDETATLKIALPDNLTTNHYNWKFRVGNGPAKDIPAAFNHSSVLNIKGGDFLEEGDFGETVNVWLNMNCSAGEEQAKGYANREAYSQTQVCLSKCGIFQNSCKSACYRNTTNIYNATYTPKLQAEYQSLNSNPISFVYLKSAPKVISKVPTDVSCYDEKDGSVKLTFNKPLLKGEELNYSLLVNNTSTISGNVTMDANNTFVISNLIKGIYVFQLIGFYDGSNTQTISPVPTTFSIEKPTPVDFSLSFTNVSCNGGKDGTITITASGGIKEGYQYSTDDGANWIPFDNPKSNTQIVYGLYPVSGTSIVYNVKVRDGNSCVAKIQSIVAEEIMLGREKSIPTTITQPTTPVTFLSKSSTEPTFKGGSNGKITVSVTGGTPIKGSSYTFQWKDNRGNEIDSNKSTTQFSNGTYAITLNNIPAGTYTLNVQDSNYNYATATNKTGCNLVPTLSITLGEPDALVVKIKVERSISCNSTNQFGNDDDFNPQDGQRDESQDATLVADVEGGVPYKGIENGGLPYQYIWSKLNTISNQWEVLNNATGIKAENLSKGSYSLNVIDKNGITQGTYVNNALETANPAIEQLVEPTKLELTFESGNVSCHSGNNGWATAKVSGGTPKTDGSYTYDWYNVEDGIIDKNKLTGLNLGTYSVTVTDSKGCIIQGKITIEEPQTAVALKYKENETISPTFHGATNGKIVAEITGGTPNTTGEAYFYKWTNKKGDIQTATGQLINGTYTITLDGIPADDYFLTVWDKNYNTITNQVMNCSIINSKVSLSEPDPLVVTFEIKQTISCNASNEFGNDKDTTPSDGQRDESQDGILIAHVKGGTPLTPTANNGLSYYFYWKKQQADGTWITWNENDETAENLSHGNYALNVKDRNGIMLGTYANNTLVTPIDATQFMQEPPKLMVTFTKGDVFCKGGNDGWATANVTGGTAPYDYEWSNGETISENTILSVGAYLVKIIDAKGCTTQRSIKIGEPLEPITLDYTEITNPSFYKATNGRIVVEVKGGTIFPDNTYWYQWKNSKGITQTTTTVQFNNGIYTITLTDLPEDTYTLTVRDANYNPATNKIGCTVINSSTTLEQPAPLVVTFEVQRTISCNVSNTFGNESDINPADGQRDESQDGILIAHVTGGIPLAADKNNGLPYFYTWKKQLADGSWMLWNDQDETAENISHGTYALNIEDANGTKLGTYVNNILTKEIDVTQFMPEPSKLGLTFTKLDVGCTTGNDGWAEAIVTGGTAPYTYQWTNEATTTRIENLTSNNYFVIVTDAKGCIIQGSVFVGDPNGVFTTETIKNPTCFQGNDGSINLDVTGGNLPYQYHWNTGATTKDIDNLVAGNYEVTVTCPYCCVYKKSFTLKAPDPIIVNIGPDRTLCNEQSLDLDASIADLNAQYSWTATNGFKSNSPTVNVTKAGTYHVKVTSSLGCIGEDSIEITTNKVAIGSEFLLSSQAYLDEEVILVNTSEPFGENTKWMIPNGVAIVDKKEKFITLKFNAIGTYTIGLKQTQGDCYAMYSKNITVEQRSTLPNVDTKNSKFITDFIVTPNPSDGNFKTIINMEDIGPVNLRLFSYNGQYSLIQKKESGKKSYSIDFNVKLAAGIYVIVLETAQQTLVKKIIIN